MRTIIKKYTSLGLLMGTSLVYAQTPSQGAKDLRTIVDGLKAMHSYGYDYELQAKFEDGKSESFKGTVAIDQQAKIMCHQSDKFEFMISGPWYYRAEHDKRAVTVIDMDKHYNGKGKQQLQDNFFSGQLTANMLDSVIVPNAEIQQYSKAGDTIRISLVLKRGTPTPIKRVEVKYILSQAKPASMIFYAVYPSVNGAKRAVNTQVIRCYNYKRETQSSCKDIHTLFSVRNNEIKLNKYKNYMLYAVI